MPGNLTARVKGAIRARLALSAHFVKNRMNGVRKEERNAGRGMGNYLTKRSRRDAECSYRSRCIFDFLHATEQEIDSCTSRKGSRMGKMGGGRRERN